MDKNACRSAVAGWPRSSRIAVWALWLLALVMVTPASATSYVYDGNGRVIAVTNEVGEAARYVYDVMGNITRVDRLAANELALFAFTPGRGVSGTQVSLQGHGFAVEPNANTVQFAGTPASVLRASGSELVVLVPAGAATGPISVTVRGQSASSSADFTVDQSARLPRVDSIAPQVANAGTTITIDGESLYPVDSQTTVRIGARAGKMGAAQNARLDFVVPPLAASGKVSVSTPYGLAVSTQDLLVLPAGVSTATVSSFRRVVPDAPAVGFSVDTAGQQVAVLVEAATGEHLDAQFIGITGGSLGWTLYDPINRSVASGTVNVNDPTALLPPATRGGTYLLLIKPTQGPASWSLAVERSRVIEAGGDSIVVATTVGSQRKRLVFSATVDQPLGLGLEGITLSSGSVMNTTVMSRDVSLGSATCYASISGCQVNVRARQTPHTVVLAPGGTLQSFSTRVTLSADLAKILQRDVPLELLVARNGQNGRLSFDAQAGESLSLQLYGQATLPAGRSVNYAVYKPDGTLLTSANTLSYLMLNLPNLPQSGNYAVFVDPDYGATVSTGVLLRDGSGGGGAVDGDAAEYATAAGGQSVYFNFTATEVDQRIGVGISDLVVDSGTYVVLYVYRPDGTSVASAVCYTSSAGCAVNVRAPMVGRYSVMVQPTSASQTMQLRAWVSNDLEAELARETPLQLGINRRGQNARLYFDGQAGETLAVQVAGQLSVPAGKQVYYQLFKPDGTLLTSVYAAGSDTLRLPTLATSGRYQLFVDPLDGANLQARITLTAGQQSGMVLDAAVGEVIAPIAGHPAFLTFSTTEADQRLGLALTDIVLSTGTYVSVTVHGPSGAQQESATCYASQVGCGLNIRAGAVGTYSVVVTPQSTTQTLRFKATLSNDQRVDLVREQPYALNIARFGQNARMRFSADAGDNLAVQISGQASSGNASVSYTVYRPDGASLTSASTTSFSELRMLKAPVSGEYVLVVDPANGATVQSRVLLTAGNGGDPVIDEGLKEVDTNIGGQATFATFEVEEIDQRIGIGISDLLVSNGSYASVYVYRPNGTSVISTTCYQTYKGCGMNLRAPEAGTYAIVVVPSTATQTLRYGVTVSNDQRRVLSRETTTVLDVPQRGQNARWTFTAQAGETLGLQVAGQSAIPLASSVSYQVFKPDGTSLVGRSITSSETLNLPTLPVSGEYSLFVDPDYGAAVTSQLRLTAGADSGAEVDGAPGEFSTSQPGQPTYLTFQAAAGEQLGLGISDLAVSSGSYVSVYVYRPGGVSLTSTTCYVSNGGCVLNVNATDGGTYSVITTPQSATQTAQFKATLSRDLRLTLPRDEAMDLSIPRRGQKARLSFGGTAGESLALQVAGQTTFPAGRSVYYRVYKPDGTSLTSLGTAAFGSQELRLPVSGTYQILVETNYGETVSSRLTLTAGSLQPVDGAPTVVTTAYGGQSTRSTFSLTAGQSVGIGLYDLTVSSGSMVNLTVYRPDGTTATSTTCYTSNPGCKVSLTAGQTGSYSLVVAPQAATQTFAYSLALSQDLTGLLQLDQGVDVVVSRRGQNARLGFTGQAGQQLSLQIAGQSTVPTGRVIYYRVYRPDGTQLTSVGTSTYGGLRLPVLPVNGAYTVLVDSTYGETMQARLTLATGSSALQIDGAAAGVATDVGGQEAYLAFTAQAGQRLGIGLTNLGVSTGTYFSAVVYRPDGNISTASCFPQYGGCEINVTATATGVYQLYATPVQADQKIRFTATVSTDVAATLVRGTPLQLSLARYGQNGWLEFSGAAGESLSMQTSNPVTHPAGGTTYYVIYRPDGVALTSFNITAGRVVPLPPLPASGSYRVMVSPTYGARCDVALTLQ